MRAAFAIVILALVAGCTVRKPGPLFCLGCTINMGRPAAAVPFQP